MLKKLDTFAMSGRAQSRPTYTSRLRSSRQNTMIKFFRKIRYNLMETGKTDSLLKLMNKNYD